MARFVREGTLMRRWLQECGRTNPLWEDEYSTGETNTNDYGGWVDYEVGSFEGRNRLRIIDGRIVFEGLQSVPRPINHPLVVPAVEMARFVGRRDKQHTEMDRWGGAGGGVLLNGDGFDWNLLQGIQARLRERYNTRALGLRGPMIIPHMALAAAGIEMDSIRCISVARDRMERVRTELEPPTGVEFEKAKRRATDSANKRRSALKVVRSYMSVPSERQDFLSGGRRWSVGVGYAPSDLGVFTNSYEVPPEGIKWRSNWGYRVDFQPENGAIRTFGVDVAAGVFSVTAEVHRLGACVFSGVGPDGKRHRYLSAFDQAESPPMYFLAQLPDRGEARNYQQAVDLLAPPIVHAARRAGKLTYRQGDIFFIQTDLTDKSLREKKARLSTVPKRGKTIYGTSHFATRVARMPNGVTFASGVATHVPGVEEPGREPEHLDVTLVGAEWFLAVRNTVPRLAATQDSATPVADVTQSTNSQEVDDVAA